jgi:hypothetical protein
MHLLTPAQQKLNVVPLADCSVGLAVLSMRHGHASRAAGDAGRLPVAALGDAQDLSSYLHSEWPIECKLHYQICAIPLALHCMLAMGPQRPTLLGDSFPLMPW